MVYQDPYGSLNPRMKVRDIVGEPLVVHGVARDKASYGSRVGALLEMVGLLPDMASATRTSSRAASASASVSRARLPWSRAW